MFLLCRGRAVGGDPSLGVVFAGLYSSADPRAGVAPGDTLEIGVSVAPDQGASRGCAYLMEGPLTEAAEIVGVQGLEYFPRQRWFRVRAEAGESSTGVLRLRIGAATSAHRVRPQFSVGVPDATGRKLVRTGKLSGEALPLRTAAARGLRITAETGGTGAVNVLSALPAGSTVVSVTQPRTGSAQVSYDGWVTYTPSPGFSGHDRLEYTVATPDAAKLTSHVNVFVGAPGQTPGVLPERPADVAFRPWQWPELTGEMPWPAPVAAVRAEPTRITGS
ncbi:Ig-like domain-containing protein [Streptomyces sp. NPDC058655]|uniref:Ig-like domain-containing protein n=1 Tax=unclassified Streptomyces TaxID=2593676 RepID=UPI00366514E3